MLLNPPFTFVGTYETVQTFHFLFFLENFLMYLKGPPLQFFRIFLQQTGFSKNPKRPPFTTYGIVRFFKMNFCFKFWFPQLTSTLYTNFVFLRPSFFRHHATFFPICFYRSPFDFHLKRKVLRA